MVTLHSKYYFLCQKNPVYTGVPRVFVTTSVFHEIIDYQTTKNCNIALACYPLALHSSSCWQDQKCKYLVYLSFVISDQKIP